MAQIEAKFWAGYEKLTTTPLESVVDKVPPGCAVEFVAGCRMIYNITTSIDPDVIFLPERGAAPINWAMEVFEEEGGKNYHKVSLPIGTHSDVISGDISGLEKPQKEKVIKAYVQTARERLGEIRRPLLIDEVQSGGTIRQAARYLDRALKDASCPGPFSIIAVQDNSNGWLTHRKAHGFRTLVNNTDPHINAAIVELPLFTVDRQEFLNHILYPSDAPQSQSPMMQMVLQNPNARRLIRGLTQGFIYPDAMEQTIEETQIGGNSTLSNGRYPDGNVNQMQYWTKQAVTSGEQNGAADWLREYASLCKASKR